MSIPTNKLKFLYRNVRSLDSKSKAMLTSALIQCHFDSNFKVQATNCPKQNNSIYS